MRIVDVSRRPDLDDYLRRTASGELLWTLHGTVYEAHDDHETLTLHREHRVLHLTMTLDGTARVSATVRSADAPEDELEKWEQLMALVETQAI